VDACHGAAIADALGARLATMIPEAEDPLADLAPFVDPAWRGASRNKSTPVSWSQAPRR
jgi:hypothetical protein